VLREEIAARYLRSGHSTRISTYAATFANQKQTVVLAAGWIWNFQIELCDLFPKEISHVHYPCTQPLRKGGLWSTHSLPMNTSTMRWTSRYFSHLLFSEKTGHSFELASCGHALAHALRQAGFLPQKARRRKGTEF